MHVLIQCPNCHAESSSESNSDLIALCPDCGERFLDAECSLEPGDVVGDYTIRAYMGYGQLGETFRAESADGSAVVLKTLERKLKVDPKLLDAGIDRALGVAMLGSLATPVAYGEADARRYLVQPFAKGESLETIGRRDGVMDETRALEYIRDAALALKQAWEADALPHCYLKPANIIIGKDGSVTVTDIGFIDIVGEGRGISAPGLEFGTPHYLAPEQAWHPEMSDFRADIYSLASILYFLVTGKAPYSGTSPAVYSKLVKPDPIVAANMRNPGLSDPCAHLLQVMMSAQPHQRHNSWEAVIGDIDRVLAGLEPERKPSDAPIEAAPLKVGTIRRVGTSQQKGIGTDVHMTTAPPTELVDPEAMELREVNKGRRREHQSVFNLDRSPTAESDMALSAPARSPDEGSTTRADANAIRSGAPPISPGAERRLSLTQQRLKRQERRKRMRDIGIVVAVLIGVLFLGLMVKFMLDTWATRRRHIALPTAVEHLAQAATERGLPVSPADSL